MANFSIAFEYMLPNETYAPTDPRYGKVTTDNDGGLVRFGVNSNSLGKALLQTNPTFYTTMPNTEAILVCSNLYNITIWQSIRGNDIQSQRVADKLLDMATNMGATEASKLCQRAVSVNVDGVIGPLTIDAINNEAENIVLKGLVYWWLWFITQTVNNNPQDKQYEDDWTTRAEKLPAVTGA